MEDHIHRYTCLGRGRGSHVNRVKEGTYSRLKGSGHAARPQQAWPKIPSSQNVCKKVAISSLLYSLACLFGQRWAKFRVPTVRSSNTDVDLPIVSADLFTNFKSKQSLHRCKMAYSEAIQSLHRLKMACLEMTKSLHRFKMAYLEATQSLHRFKMACLEATKSLHLYKNGCLQATQSLPEFK